MGNAAATLADSDFSRAFESFLSEFGHRGYHESDVMLPRFAEDPGRILRLIQLHIRAGGGPDPVQHAAERRHARESATADVRRLLRIGTSRFGFAGRWAAFSGVCHALQRLLAMRDECRHVTTLLLAHLRRVTLEIGERACRQGLLADREDVFFLEWDELPRVLIDKHADWRRLVADRRRQHARNAERDVPDLLRGDGSAEGGIAAAHSDGGGELWGYGVSPGTVTGRVRVLRSSDDIGCLSRDVIAVFPAIEPTLAPIFPVVRGLVAEMGGLLSHAAILAREYGLPAVVSVADATRRLRDGEHVELDGATGRIRVLERVE